MLAGRNVRWTIFTLAAVVVTGLVVHAQDKGSGASGTWNWSYQGFGGNQVDITLKLKQDGDKLTGTITGFQGQENEIKDGMVKDGKVTFKVVRELGGQTNTTTYMGTLSGDSLKGKSETVSTREFDAKRAGAVGRNYPLSGYSDAGATERRAAPDSKKYLRRWWSLPSESGGISYVCTHTYTDPMATKTITIDTEAYRRLKTVQQENESFSQTIKRVVPEPISTAELIRLFRRAGSQLSEGFFRGVESALAARNSGQIWRESMACLDTTVLLDLAGRGGRRRRAAAEAKLRQLEHDRPHSVTRFTIAELLVGFELAADPARECAVLDPILAKLRVLEFDDRSMKIYAKILVHLRALGLLAGVMDMLIASVSLAEGQRFVTRNTQHFTHIPGLRMDTY